MTKIERKLNEAISLAGELIAIIKVNHARGTFSQATDHDIDNFLEPYNKRLDELTKNGKLLSEIVVNFLHEMDDNVNIRARAAGEELRKQLTSK